MSSRIFQGVVTQLSEAAGLPLGVLDTDGIVISASDTALIGEKWPDAVNAIAAMPDAPVYCDDYTFLTLKGWNPAFGFSVFVKIGKTRICTFCITSVVGKIAFRILISVKLNPLFCRHKMPPR